MTTDVSGEPGTTPTAVPAVPSPGGPTSRTASADSADTQVLTEVDVAVLMSGAEGPLPVSATAPALGAASSEATLACPECGTVTTVNLARRSATDFCPSCDYPLFWARPGQPVAVATAGEDARRRLPGASGSTVLATAPCPSCAELNLPSAALCVRCGSSMAPPLPPVPVPLPMPEPVVEVASPPPLPEPVRFPWWWLAAMSTVGAIIAALSRVL
ncbi:hypothetical protein [Georgenia yuyongxinii]